jgi:hypothetical protein
MLLSILSLRESIRNNYSIAYRFITVPFLRIMPFFSEF